MRLKLFELKLLTSVSPAHTWSVLQDGKSNEMIKCHFERPVHLTVWSSHDVKRLKDVWNDWVSYLAWWLPVVTYNLLNANQQKVGSWKILQFLHQLY